MNLLRPWAFLISATTSAKVLRILDETVADCPLDQNVGVYTPGGFILFSAANDSDLNEAKHAIRKSKYIQTHPKVGIFYSINQSKDFLFYQHNFFEKATVISHKITSLNTPQSLFEVLS
jgi:hypothetical protein